MISEGSCNTENIFFSENSRKLAAEKNSLPSGINDILKDIIYYNTISQYYWFFIIK